VGLRHECEEVARRVLDRGQTLLVDLDLPRSQGLEVDPDAVFLATLERSKNEKFARRMAEQAIAMGDPKHWPEGYEVEEYRGKEKKGASDSAGDEASGETHEGEEERELEDAKRLLEKLDVASADVDEKV
jgi:hypothetical protein